MITKRFALITLISSLAVFSWAALPVVDGFYGFDTNQWEQFWPVEADLDFVTPAAAGIPDSPNGTGNLMKVECTHTDLTSFGIVAGEDTDNNYNVKVQAYIPVTNALDPALEAYIYHMVIFYQDANGYGRLHTHFNENTGEIANPRIRLQITNPSFVHTDVWESPADFQHSEGWHELRIELNGTTANSYYDGNLLGASDWTAAAATRTAGKFGVGGFLNAAGTLTTYFSGFKAWQGVEPADPSPPSSADSATWVYYE